MTEKEGALQKQPTALGHLPARRSDHGDHERRGVPH
jgi:hypothetical protein